MSLLTTDILGYVLVLFLFAAMEDSGRVIESCLFVCLRLRMRQPRSALRV
jgi:hypothetical protein